VPIFPLAIIAVWNIFKPRRVGAVSSGRAELPPSSTMLPLPPSKETTSFNGSNKYSDSLQAPSAIIETVNGTVFIR
jgi:hypothetical protein